MGKAWYSSLWAPHNPEAAGSSPAPAIIKAYTSKCKPIFLP